jgi:hypothetical protein
MPIVIQLGLLTWRHNAQQILSSTDREGTRQQRAVDGRQEQQATGLQITVSVHHVGL